jgi:single-strand DNA-binding protein
VSVCPVTVIGRLVEDPAVKFVGNPQRAVCNMRLAYDYSANETNFINVVTWDKHAESCANVLTKGRLVAATGRLHLRQWEAEGKKGISPEIANASVQFLDRAKTNEGETVTAPAAAAAEDSPAMNLDDLPF